jgi:protein-S-isoprenylcysteine O-methyltransferase Ste14
MAAGAAKRVKEMTNIAPKGEKVGDEHEALGRYQHWRRIWLATMIALLAAFLLFVSTAWEKEQDELIEAVGVSLIGAAILGRLWCTLYIGGRKSDTVVSSGPYSIMRNPLYFFSAIGAAGVGAQSGSIAVALLFGFLCVIAFHFVIRREEGFLSGQFGSDYRDYLVRVPRFWPNVRLFRDDAVLSVHPDRLYVTFLDGLVFFAALPAFEGVEYLQQSGVAPVLLRLY